MNIHVYTSCSVNYLPKARALADSIANFSPDTKLTLLLNDVIPDWLNLATEPFYAVWTPYDLGYSPSWVFQHNVMELCTAVKGKALCRLIEEGEADLYVYLDPDCYVFYNLAILNEYMGEASIGLVPHILSAAETDIGVQLTEISVVEHGTYNLGHLIVRPDENGKKLAKWWADRLDKYCFEDKDRGLFTDQRWMDLVPAIFDGVKILRLPNIDVASWNLFEKRISQKNSGDIASFFVDEYPLVTYHFSGTGSQGAHRYIREIFDSGNGATAEIERIYEAAIQKFGQDELGHWQYGFDYFDSGTLVTSEARKVYRANIDLQKHFYDPFDCSDVDSYEHWLQLNRPSIISGIRLSNRMLIQAYMELFDEEYYLKKYPQVANLIRNGVFNNALDHYEKIGSALLYNPNSFFMAEYYYSDAKNFDGYILRENRGKKQGTLLWHYLTKGLENNVEPVPYFDSNWYISEYEDVKVALCLGGISCPFSHYYNTGTTEGRKPHFLFDPYTYLASNDTAQKLVESGKVRGAFGAFLNLNFA